MNEKIQMVRKISNRLAIALAILVALFIPGALYAHSNPGTTIISAPLAAFAAGVIGGFVGLQRRLKGMSEDDLTLLANSWVYVCLSPLVGGILAVVVYILFISELLAGDLFPTFVPDDAAQTASVADATNSLTAMAADSIQQATAAGKPKGLSAIFEIHGTAADYGKMMFWSFLAGFSERFATDIINRFESDATVGDKPTA